MIFATFENHFLRINPKKLDDRVIHENDGMFPSNLPIKNRFMNHFLIFFSGIIIRKCFSKVAKITEISASSENCFFGNKTQVISKGHEKTSEAYFIKWTTSGEPPVGLKSS